MEDIFVWSEKYELGIEDIDSEHKKLFELANNTFSMSHDEAKYVFVQLFEYVDFHFKHEEEYMKAIDYIDLEEHKKLHIDFITELSNASKVGVESPAAFVKLQSLVYLWLIRHIMQEDQKIKNVLDNAV